MDINDRLFVEIHPLTSGQIPHPHPIDEARFDPAYVYKVLGMYNPSETSECYFVLSNPQRQIWFIPQRHLLAYGLIDSDELCIPINRAADLRRGRRMPVSPVRSMLDDVKPVEKNGHEFNQRSDHKQIS